MRRMAKIAGWIIASMLGLAVLLIGLVLVIGNTDSGRVFIARMTAELSDDHVRLAGIHGSFPAALDLDRLELRDASGLWLWADHVSLRWAPLALLERHIDIDMLRIARLHVERAPLPDNDKKQTSSSSSSLPLTDLRAFSIDALELGPALAGAPTSLFVKGNVHARSLDDADARVTARRTAGNGDYDVLLHFDTKSMVASVNLQEPANGPLANLIKLPDLGALSVVARLHGPRQAERVQLVVDAGPLRARALGSLDLDHHQADINVDVSSPEMTPTTGLSWKAIQVHGRLHGPWVTPIAEGNLSIQSLTAPGGTRLKNAEAHVSANGITLVFNAGIDGLRIPGKAPAVFEDSRLALTGALKLNDPQRPAELTATHRLFNLRAKARTAGEQHGDLTLQIPDLQPFSALAGANIEGDARLGAHIERTASVIHANANTDAHVEGGSAAWAGLLRGGPTQLELVAQITDEKFSLERLRLKAPALAVSAHATAMRNDEQKLDAKYDVQLPQLARLSSALAGTMSVTGTVTGAQNALSIDTRLTTSLSVRGSPEGTLSARLQAKGAPQSLEATLSAGGELDGAPLSLDAALEPVAGGAYHATIQRADWKSAHADADITVGKDPAQAHGTGQFKVTELSDLNRIVGSPLSGAVNGRFMLAGRTRAQLQLQAQQVVVGGVSATAQLNGDGPPDALKISLVADSPALGGQPAHIDLSMFANATAKELRLVSLNGSYHEQDIHLAQPALLKMAEGVEVRGLKLRAGDATFDLDGRLSPELNARADIRQVKAELVNAFVPNALASGTIEAHATLLGTAKAPVGDIYLQAHEIRAQRPAAQGLPATDLRATAQLKGEIARVEMHTTAGTNSQMTLLGQAPLTAEGSLDLKLSGDLDVALLNPILEARGQHVTGKLVIDTAVTGNVTTPDIAGTVRLNNGSIRDYSHGLNLFDITGLVTGQHGVLRIDEITARAPPGRLSVQGTIGVLQPRMPVELNLIAKDAQAVSNNLLTANLDAQVHVSGAARERLDVEGNIHVNRADIAIPGALPPSVTVLDVERPGAPAPAPDPHPLIINLRLAVDAPRRILVNGRGLDAEMGGKLRIVGTTAAPVVEGGFELQRGSFTLANSRLTFTEGNVTFNGAGLQRKLDPSIDFTAQTQAADITTIVHITGLADAPQIELTSTPELPQDEILARLLFGEPAAQLSALQLVETGAALASLRGGGNGSSLNPLGRVQKALGLDRLSVASGGGGGNSGTANTSSSAQDSGTSVQAGRYVSDRVYVGVKESTSGASQVAVDVDLTKRLKVQAKLGNGSTTTQGVTPENDPGSSIGLAYQFEY